MTSSFAPLTGMKRAVSLAAILRQAFIGLFHRRGDSLAQSVLNSAPPTDLML